MKKIEFIDFNISEGYISFICNRFENDVLIDSNELYFDLSEDIFVNNNLIALSISTLCGRSYDEIFLDLIINQETFDNIVSFTHSNLLVKDIDNLINTRSNFNDKILLNFSGGFDSLAALCLAPQNKLNLVAVDFEGSFSREKVFFNKFNPYVVRTNFRLWGYDKEHWSFLGVASILFSDYSGANSIAFGTIFEGSYYNFGKDIYKVTEKKVPPFEFAGLDNDIPYVRGITEIGTAMIIANFKPYLIEDSLISLANENTEKRYRKQLLLSIVNNKFDLNIKIPWAESPSRKINFGRKFALDFLCLYQLKYAGIEETSNMISNIPKEAIDLSNKLSLEFYEKFNTNFLNRIPKDYRSEYLYRLAQANVYPFNENDFKEYEEVLRFLSNYHDVLKRFLR